MIWFSTCCFLDFHCDCFKFHSFIVDIRKRHPNAYGFQNFLVTAMAQTNGDLTVTASVGSLDAHSDIPIVEEDER